MKKKHGATLGSYWVDAPCGYMTSYSCLQCGNFWNHCRDKFGEETENDEFCHWKKSSFYRKK